MYYVLIKSKGYIYIQMNGRLSLFFCDLKEKKKKVYINKSCLYKYMIKNFLFHDYLNL